MGEIDFRDWLSMCGEALLVESLLVLTEERELRGGRFVRGWEEASLF